MSSQVLSWLTTGPILYPEGLWGHRCTHIWSDLHMQQGERGYSVLSGLLEGELPLKKKKKTLQKNKVSKGVHGLLMYQISSLWHRLDLSIAAEQRKITWDLLFLCADNHDKPLYGQKKRGIRLSAPEYTASSRCVL